MMRITDEHVASLALLLRERVGFEVRSEGYDLLRTALSDRLREKDESDVDRYLAQLTTEEEEFERLLPFVTIGKTSFFRDPGQFRALRALLPSLLADARAEGRRLSIWSAACASGEEVYSIAITLLEAGVAPYEVELLATDINPEAIAACARGRYDESRVEPISPERIARFFVRHGHEYAAGPDLRAMVSGFRTHNLHADVYPLPESGAWDVIFCRNVLIYFDRQGIRRVAERLFEHLRPGGWLLLGYSESLFKLFDGFELVEINGAFLYRRPPPPRPTAAPPAVEETPAVPPQPPPSRRARPKTPSPDRPADAAAASPAQRPAAPAGRPSDPLARAVARIQAGDFSGAARLLETALERAPRQDLLLTLANVYSLLRRHQDAERCFERALAEDSLAPEALLFQGLHYLERSRLPEAERALSRVVYLQPECALAHYLLGRCQEKLRRPDSARRSYQNALRALGTAQRKLGAFYPDLPEEPPQLEAAVRLALASL